MLGSHSAASTAPCLRRKLSPSHSLWSRLWEPRSSPHSPLSTATSFSSPTFFSKPLEKTSKRLKSLPYPHSLSSSSPLQLTHTLLANSSLFSPPNSYPSPCFTLHTNSLYSSPSNRGYHCDLNSLIDENLLSRVEYVGKKKIKVFSIDEIIKFTSRKPNNVWLLHAANWLREEMPVRLAHSIRKFSRIPFAIVNNQFIRKVYNQYIISFLELEAFEAIKSLHQESNFAAVLNELVEAHFDVLQLMSKGVKETKALYPDIDLDPFLRELFLLRIGNRLLAEHLLNFHADLIKKSPSDPEYVGVVHRFASPYRIIQQCAKLVTQQTLEIYGVCPEVSILGDTNLTFPYIPEHIRYVVFELLKNACFATLQLFVSDPLPKVTVTIQKGEKVILIKISDQGGGISEDLKDKIWQFGFSTANNKSKVFPVKEQGQLLMAGYGFGIPISKLYTQYFGGDLDIKSFSGCGTDVYAVFPLLADSITIEKFSAN